MKNALAKTLSGLLALCMVFVMVACNSSSSSSGQDVKPVTIRVIAHQELEVVLAPFFNDFMQKNSNIIIEVLYGVDQLDQIDSNFPPDLLFMGNVGLDQIKNKFEDLNPLMDEYFAGENASEYSDAAAFKDTFIPGVLDMLSRDDKLLVLPTNANVSLLYYNETLFDEAGLDYPTNEWTYSDFVDAGVAMTKKDGDAYSQWGCTTTYGWWGEWLLYCRQFGGDFYAADGVTPAFDSPEFQKGIDFFKNKSTSADAKFAVNPYSTAIGESDLGSFGGGKVAMDFGGHTGNWPSYRALDGFKWNVAMLPTPDGMPDATGSEIAVEGYGLYNQSQNKAEAFAVLMAMFSTDGQKMFGGQGRLIPTTTYREIVLATPVAERNSPTNMEAVFAQMEKAMPLPTNPNFSASAQAPIGNELEKYITGQHATYAEFAAAAIKAVQDYVATVE